MKRYWFLLSEGNIVLSHAHGHYAVPLGEGSPLGHDEGVIALPALDGMDCVAQHYDGKRLPAELCTVPLRKSFELLAPAFYEMAGKAEELLDWDIETRYCGRCGAVMTWSTTISKRCPHCHHEIWPKLSPAGIVLIKRDDKILLVRARNFRGDFYGLVAGFVETGESVERCIEREVREETGLTIHRLRYFGSQAWPYPCSLMLGFVAEYKEGTLRLQEDELKEARWFGRDELPTIPGRVSLARRLIDAWVAGEV